VAELGEHLDEERKKEWTLFNHVHVLFRVFLLGPSAAAAIRTDDPAVWDSLTGTGVGGIRLNGSFSMKCLHLQTASMIGLGWHPAGDWLLEHLGDLECSAPGEWPCPGK
jgi:hypothetical protein